MESGELVNVEGREETCIGGGESRGVELRGRMGVAKYVNERGKLDPSMIAVQPTGFKCWSVDHNRDLTGRLKDEEAVCRV